MHDAEPAHDASPIQHGRDAGREVALADRLARRARRALHVVHVRREVVEDLGDRAVLELAADLAEQPLRLVGDADAVGARLDLAQALLGADDARTMIDRGNSRSSSRNSAADCVDGTPR